MLSSPYVSRPAVTGLSSLLPCPETLDSLPGAQPLLESLENLEGPLRGEVETRGLARCGYGFRKTRHLRGLWTGPEGSMPTSALHSSHRVPSTGRPAPLEFYCSLQTCLSPGLGKPKAVLGSGDYQGSGQAQQEGLGRGQAPRRMGEGAGNGVSSFSSPLGFERWNTSMPAGLP